VLWQANGTGELDRAVKFAAETVEGQTRRAHRLFRSVVHATCFTAAVHRVLVLRHGASTWNAEGRWQGWLDAPLTSAGEEDAARRARELAHDGVNPRAVYTSDLGRARRTAEIIAAHVERPVIADEGFRERNGGEWQGRTKDEIDANWPGMRAAWRRGELDAPPGGESDAEVLTRVDAAIARALTHVGAGELVIVTHHGVLRTLSVRAGIEPATLIPNLGGYWFAVEHGQLVDPEPVDDLAPDADAPAVE
jgi:glucosyl-3-phosphoglycerate phosphatase